MYLTVEDALTIYPLSEGKLTAGRKGLRRIVKSVNVMDAPDISDWVREGDILFTTAYLMKDNPAEGVKLLRKLAAKRAAAIGIKLGRFWTSVPDDMLAEADQLGFPLIELPFPFTFSDQMKGLFHAELQKNTRLLQSVLDKQKELIRFALAPDGSEEMFTRIGSILGTPLAVVGLRGQILYSNLTPEELHLLKKRSQKQTSHWIRTDTGKLLFLPLKSAEAGEDDVGCAAFRAPGGMPFKEEEGLYHQAAEIISHHLNAIERAHMEQATQNEFASLLKNYLKHHISIETLLECAIRLSIPFGNAPFICVLTSVAAASTPKQQRLLRTIRQELHYHPLLKELSNLHFQLEGSILSIYPAEAKSDGGKLADLLARVFTDIATEADGSLRIALSHAQHKPDHLDKAYRECLDALETAERLHIEHFVVVFDSVEMAYIFQSIPSDNIRRFVDMTLSPLFDKAPDTAQELLRTLELYIENNGQINETAKQLFIHRNTAAYRLEKIEELLQVDFKSYPHLLKLKLMLLFKRMLN